MMLEAIIATGFIVTILILYFKLNKLIAAVIQQTTYAQQEMQGIWKQAKDQLDSLRAYYEDMSAKLVRFTEEARHIAKTTKQYHEQITTDFAVYSKNMHDLFEEKAQLQNQLILLLKKAQEDHHRKMEELQEQSKEGLEEIFSDKLTEFCCKIKENYQEIGIMFEEMKDELANMVHSVHESRQKTEAAYVNFSAMLGSLDLSLKQTIQVTQTTLSEMKSLGEKDIELLEKMLR